MTLTTTRTALHGCATAGAGADGVVHLLDSASGTTFCGLPRGVCRPPGRFLVDGCMRCARRAEAEGFTWAAEAQREFVSIERFLAHQRIAR